MSDDAGVRSVRVAVALADRFAELLKGPTTVRAHRQHGALFGVSGDEEGLSMRIGEAQQLYPELWRHLDDARAAFAARGVDVRAYDLVRAGEGPSLGAQVEVQQTAGAFARSTSARRRPPSTSRACSAPAAPRRR